MSYTGMDTGLGTDEHWMMSAMHLERGGHRLDIPANDWDKLQRIIVSHHPLKRYSKASKALVWQHRRRLSMYPSALPVVLLAAPWHRRVAVQEAYNLLRIWSPPSPQLALQLLAAKYVLTCITEGRREDALAERENVVCVCVVCTCSCVG